MMCVVACALFLAAATAAPPVDSLRWAGAKAAFSNEEALRRYAAGRLLEERGEGDQALAEYYRVLLLDPSAADVARRISEVSARLGEAERSLEFADRSLAIEPHHARGLWLKGTALFNLGRPDESLFCLEAAVDADSSDTDYLRTLARVAEHLDRVDRVARACERVVALDENDGEAWFQLATARARLQDFQSAERALGRAAEINPLRPGLEFVEGWVEEGLGRRRSAIELYRRHLSAHSGDQVARRRVVNLLSQEKRYAEAYGEARAVARSNPTDLEALEAEADLAFAAGRPADGLQVIARIEQLGNDNPEIIGRLVGVLGHHERGRAGVELADRWAARHDRDCRGAVLAAQARRLAGQNRAAIEIARRGLELCPDSLGPRVTLARMYETEQHFAEAERVWSEAAVRFPTHVGVALDLSFCRERLGDLAGAQQAARDALQRHPDNPTVLNFLGYLLADHNQALDEAADLINRALKQEPDNGAFIDSMGWVHYRLGRLDEARRELERAVALTGDDPVVHEHLGDVYKDLRLLDLAKDQYQKSVAGDRTNPRVKAKLAEIR